METARESLVHILEEAKSLVSREGNDFAWSAWRDREHAISEIESYIAKVKLGDHSSVTDLSLMFAPTGDLQEVSLSSGWAQDFLALASRFDAVKNA